MPPKKRTSARRGGDGPAAKKVCAGAAEVNGRKVRWEWEADGGKWMQFKDSINMDLTDTFNKKKEQISVDVAPKATMLLQPFKMVQKNKKTGYERRLRMAILDPSDSEFYIWQWEDEHGKWNPYSAATSLDLEEAMEKKKTGTVAIEACHRSYEVDVGKMEQVNTVTNVKRKVGRDKSDAAAAEGEDNTASASTSTASASVKQEEEEEEEPPAKKGRGRGRSAKSATVKEEEEEEEEEPKKGKGRGKSAAKSGKKEENGEGDTKSVVRQVNLKVGSAPVDAECPKAEKCHVFEEHGVIWDCMLNQTNIGNNNNKYYLIQLLQETGKQLYYVWQRWGRVGYKGQTNIVICGRNIKQAKEAFCKKFRDKTLNDWANRDSFSKVAGKYDLVQLDYSAQEEDQADGPATPEEEEGDKKTPDSKLPQKVQDLIKLICDVKSMEEAVVEMKYDAKKAPLGKLTKEQIKEGYESLKAIEELINAKKFGRELTDACSEFYTRIPHDFGMKVPPLIRTPQQVKEKLQLLEALEDIQYAIKMLKEGDKSENPVDRHYHALRCDLQPLDHSSDDFKLIEDYLLTTHAATHNMYKMKLLDVFEVDKQGEKEQFSDYGNRMLLWHGSRLTNWAGILGQGLRIAPPEAPVTGYMFGKGVYFADMSSKSANYCFATRQKNVGLLLLCDVSLGNIVEKLEADYYAQKLPAGKHSVKGCGSVAPDPATHKKLSDGVVVPVGKGKDTGVKSPTGYTLNYNEFIVYKTKQIRMRYLLKVQFNFK